MPPKRSSNSQLVYSTDGGPQPASPRAARRTGKAGPSSAPPRDGVVRVGRQTKGRKGKGVTIVTGAPVSGADLEALSRELKTLCGAGGTLRGDVIEIQGDHRERIIAVLDAKGWKPKRAGG